MLVFCFNTRRARNDRIMRLDLLVWDWNRAQVVWNGITDKGCDWAEHFFICRLLTFSENEIKLKYIHKFLLKQFNIENKSCISRNGANSTRPIAVLWFNCECSGFVYGSAFYILSNTQELFRPNI